MAADTKLSRRSAIKAGLVILGSGAAASQARAQDPDPDDDRLPKLSKARVHYQWKPNPQGSHCSICANFNAPSSCHIVEGEISGGGYCLVFSPTDIDLNALPPTKS
jgi:hypothetical protein